MERRSEDNDKESIRKFVQVRRKSIESRNKKRQLCPFEKKDGKF